MGSAVSLPRFTSRTATSQPHSPISLRALATEIAARRLQGRRLSVAERYPAQPGRHPLPQVPVWSFVIYRRDGRCVSRFCSCSCQDSPGRAYQPPQQPRRDKVELDLALETLLGYALNNG